MVESEKVDGNLPEKCYRKIVAGRWKRTREDLTISSGMRVSDQRCALFVVASAGRR
jgi:hypothetical protein